MHKKKNALLLVLSIMLLNSTVVYGKTYEIKSDKLNGTIECLSDDESDKNEINEVATSEEIKMDNKKVYDGLLNGKKIIKADKEPEDRFIGAYVLDDEANIYIDSNYIYLLNKDGRYYRDNLTPLMELNKDYIYTDKYTKDIQDFVDSLGIKGLNIGKLSMVNISADEMREYEEYINSEIPEEKRKYKDSWDSNDDLEVVFGYQRINNIPILPPIVLQSAKMLVESTDNTPIVAMFNKEGRAYIYLGQIYEVKNTGKKIKIKPFKDIVSNIEEKYNNILTEKTFKPISAKLMYNIEQDQNNEKKYNVIPIWRVTVEDEKGIKTASIYNATTGAEIIVGGMNLAK